MSSICKCPRCGERSLEVLDSYSHCINCLYVNDRWENPESDYFKALLDIKEIEIDQTNETHQKDKEEKIKKTERIQNENIKCA